MESNITVGDQSSSENNHSNVNKHGSVSGLRKSKVKIIFLLACLAIAILAVSLWLAGRNNPESKNPAPNPVALSYQKQLPKLAEAVKKNPDSAGAHISYGEALYVTGNKKAAKDQYVAAVKLDSQNATLQNNLGNTYRDLGDYDSAVAAYKRAIQSAPTNQNAYVNLANLQIYTLKKPTDGIETYKLALQKLGAIPQFQILLGLAYEQNGQIDKAKSTYQAVLSADKDNLPAKDNLARLQK